MAFENSLKSYHMTLIQDELPYFRLYMCYRRNLGVYFHIFEVQEHNTDITISAISTIDLQIQSHTLFLLDLPYFRLGSYYRRDLGVYFHIFKVKDHNYDITNTTVLSCDLQTQGHELFCSPFHISVSFCAIGKISVSISTYSRSRITIII